MRSLAWDALQGTKFSDLGWSLPLVTRHFIIKVFQVLNLLIMAQIFIVMRKVHAQLFASLRRALL